MLEVGLLTLGWLQALLLPLTRLGAFFLAAPLFPQVASNVRVRLIYAAALCVLMLPVLPSTMTPPQAPFGEPNVLLLLNEALLGVACGLALQFVTAAVVLAGEQISMSLGIGFAQAFDPTVGSTPVVSQFLNLLALLVFITTGGHTVVIATMTESLRTLPPGSFSVLDLGTWLEASSTIFKGAALLCAPLLLAMLSVNIGMGVLQRSTPSLNVFSVGFAVSLIAGFALLFILLPMISERIIELWQQSAEFIRQRLLGAR